MVARTAEIAFNTELGNALRRKHPRWGDCIRVESTGTLREGGGLQPDLVVDESGGLPVIVETEFAPAPTVEKDATARLGKTPRDDGRAIEQSIALRIPESLSTASQKDIQKAIKDEENFEFCVFSVDHDEPGNDPIRWPESGWISGNANDLANCIELVALSENRIAKGLDALERGVAQAATRLIKQSPGILPKIASELHQESGEQTTRMAMAIVANAFTFHMAILGTDKRIESVETVWRGHEGLKLTKLLDHWEMIYTQINYWPIFKIASDVLKPVPPQVAEGILAMLAGVAQQLASLGATSQHDLCGRMFQRLISDRKFLATFYTLPSSAALLAELAISRMDIDWGDTEAIKNLRIADFACGTGALLNASYGAIAARHRRANGDDEKIHAQLMESVFWGCDILPSATHLTATVLSSVHPGTPFADTKIITIPYGEQRQKLGIFAENTIALGSLDLLESEGLFSFFESGQETMRGKARKRKSKISAKNRVDIKHGDYDMVIMNPPFTRPTNHEGAHGTVPIPSFAGFQNSADEQKAMSDRLKEIRTKLTTKTDKPAGHGNAGLASNFIDIGHVTVKEGGVLALVLPSTFLQGESWGNARELLDKHYKDIMLISIAATGSTEQAFSWDTGMAEILLVATKKTQDELIKSRKEKLDSTVSITLRHRPPTILEAVKLARMIECMDNSEEFRHISIGSGMRIGNYVHGTIKDVSNCGGVIGREVIEAGRALARGQISLPRGCKPSNFPIIGLGKLGKRGLLSRDIYGAGKGGGAKKERDGLPRGPFAMFKIQENFTPTWPALCNHDATRETRMIVEADSQGEVRSKCEEKAKKVWEATASRLHFNCDFRTTSQPLAACITLKPSLGGTAWPNFICKNPQWEKPLALWANTTLGLIAFWWMGTRQQIGRTRLKITRLPELPVLDMRKLSDAQITKANAVFDEFSTRELLPANEAYRDETRHALDRAVLIDILGLGEDVLEPLSLLRAQWCEEPSVHGGKGR